jgi:uncharacterized protein YbjT (DUF2867 family)
MTQSKTVLVLGAYGLIGAALVRALQHAGHSVVGLGRSTRQATRAFPSLRWVMLDLATMRAPEAWHRHLEGIDVVVNAAGALQDGLKDNLSAVHDSAICTLVDACASAPEILFVQISAPGATLTADTEFARSKARADAHLKDSALNWIILRPGIVIGADAYGGTALLRMLAAVPLVQPLVFADRPLQTVALFDVAAAVGDAVAGKVTPGTDVDLVEADTHTLAETVARFRQWLGYAPARATVSLPAWLGYAIAGLADVLGRLGWRSPLRTTALKVIDQGVRGNPLPWRSLAGAELRSLDETLADLPSTIQERWFARLYLLLPFVVVILALFWIASGAIGLWRLDAAANVLAETPLPDALARLTVLAGGIADLTLGVAIVVRRWARPACLGMIALTAAYLMAGTLLTPDLWADPLGPFVKTLPGAFLALVAWAILEER